MTTQQIQQDTPPDTRSRIMEGLSDVLTTSGIAGFSVQAVADQAGVSHRTVYRYYPSREALLEGIADYLQVPLRDLGLPSLPSSFDEVVTSVRPLYEFFEANSRFMEAMVIVRLALGFEPKRSRERTTGFVDLIAIEAPHLEPAEAERYAMGLRAIASSQHWYVLTRRLNLTSAEAAEVTADSLRALIGEIRRRNSRQRPQRNQ